MATNIADKIPPQSLEAEMAVLGSMLIEKEAVAKAMDIITARDFYKDLHRQTFTAIAELDRDNQPIDVITLYDKLKKSGVFLDAGGASYLNSLVDMVQTAANVEQYAQIVRDKSILRQLINAGTETVSQSFNEAYPVEEILDKSQAALFSISQSQKSGEFVAISDLVRPTLNILDKLHSDKRDITGLRTGFNELDSLTAGLQPSDLIIIAARPSMGKTTLGLNIASNVALKEKKPVIIFSLEMSKEALTMRFLSSIAGVDGNNLRKGRFEGNDWAKVTTAGQMLATAPIYIDDNSSTTAMEMRARARRLALRLENAKTPLAMIMIDYIQIMGGSGRKESRQIEVSDISRSLKGLAKDLKVPVVALAQLSRKPEERGKGINSGNSEPILSDLRESGAIEQDADLVAFIHYNRNDLIESSDKTVEADLLIRKQRNGPTGNVHLIFESKYTRFTTRDYRERQED